MTKASWQPTATLSALQQRAQLIAKVRAFFVERGILEVETPLLCHATVTDPHLHSLQASMSQKIFYLQTSPEYCMKRLLAAGSGPIFQICKAFREDEQGAFHNPEFTMLEWYRPGFDHHALMDEVEELLRWVLNCGAAERWSYQQIFLKLLALDPLTASDVELKERADAYGLAQVVGDVQPDRDLFLQWLMSEAIEPHIGQSVPCFVYDFPASQAALARLNPQDARVGERFEVYFKGLELANGFHELADSAEQRRRFEMDLVKRQRLGYPAVPVDEFLLAALQGDFPDSAGVALGLDRLVMLALQEGRLADVMAFVISNS